MLDESAARLDDAYRLLSTVARTDPQPVASEEWLRDNYHVVQDQVREIRQDLPRKLLPRAAQAGRRPVRRAIRASIVLARELIAHTAGRFDLETLVEFAARISATSPLSIGETWAVPIMLRLALVEELRRLADGVVARAAQPREGAAVARANWPRGADWTATPDRSRAAGRPRRTTGGCRPPSSSSCCSGCATSRRRRRPAWQALQRALEAQDDSAEEMLRQRASARGGRPARHRQRHHAACGCCRRSTGRCSSSASAWSSSILRDDPAGAYAQMDFPTRDRYRHSVEQLAKRARRPEIDVAATRDRARPRRRSSDDPQHDRRHHVGYYLISRGRFRLEQEVGYPADAARAAGAVRLPAPGARLPRARSRVTIAAQRRQPAGLRRPPRRDDRRALARRAGGRCIPVSELVISLLNLIVTAQVPPRQLPKLDMRDGIPAGDRTMVVVPAIVDSRGARSMALLRRPRGALPRQPRSAPALRAARPTFPTPTRAVAAGDDGAASTPRSDGIDELNERHGADRFFLFHRERRWNAGEQRWMGWERKRGKLAEFNRLLRGATDTSFIVQPRRPARCCRGALRDHARLRHAAAAGRGAARLVGTLAHPLNRPRFDASARPRHRGLRHPAAARRRQRRQRQPHRCSRRCSPGTSASIRTRPPSRTSIRICFTKAATSARASTTSTRSKRRSAAACPRTRS